MKNPLVSILIPAYNAEKTIAETLESALAQTWRRTEIVVADDGSTDATPEILLRYRSRGVRSVRRENGGLSAAQNTAYRHCEGDFVQWLDADDLLAAEKIERQLASLRPEDGPKVLLSSAWAPFFYRVRGARFVRNTLWQDLSPVEWLLRKLGENLHMQNATWLVSRELSEAAGPWDETLKYDQDGEYFTRVLVASAGTRFVPGTGIFYRTGGTQRISYVGSSRPKKESLLRSMRLHVQYLLSMEDSTRTRAACLTYLQNWYEHFYPDEPDLSAELRRLAGEFGGELRKPGLRWKYAWIEPVLGRNAARRAQTAAPLIRAKLARGWDRAMHRLERRPAGNVINE